MLNAKQAFWGSRLQAACPPHPRHADLTGGRSSTAKGVGMRGWARIPDFTRSIHEAFAKVYRQLQDSEASDGFERTFTFKEPIVSKHSFDQDGPEPLS